MPRNLRLTWQKGSGGRIGRWRKKYKGKLHYFPGGRGKTDREAYEAALKAWETLKVRIDDAAHRPHQQDYERASVEWEQVLAWSNRHGDRAVADEAWQKLESLRARLKAPVLRPLSAGDWFASRFQAPTIQIPDDLFTRTVAELKNGDVRFSAVPKIDLQTAQSISNQLNGSPQRIAEEIWQDRLHSQQRRTAADEDSLQIHAERYVTHKREQVGVQNLSSGRLYAIQLHLSDFCDWLGKDTSIHDIDGSELLRYRSRVLERVEKTQWSRITARHYLTTVKAFIRWLWTLEVIPALPRILDGRTDFLKVGDSTSVAEIFTAAQVQDLLKHAPRRTRLYILLMLNCGMTQKDISDLKCDEVDWEAGRIRRKRSKTSTHRNVPVVDYLLWPETFRLLAIARSTDPKGRVLLNSNGSPLCTEVVEEDGKYRKSDNVKNAFDRVRKKLGLKVSLKGLKKTSATLLRDNEQFHGLEGLFLGHAPKSMADRHYTQPPKKLFDRALLWLGGQYGIETVLAEAGEES